MGQVVAVTGMHRSGTSLATRLVALLGVSLGDPAQLMEPGRDNPAGYWENRLIREIDDLVLAELGGSWEHPPVLAPGWERDARLDGLRAEAATILDGAFGPAAARPASYGWKDPRLCLLLPFWRTVAPVTDVVAVVRDPAQVGDSLHVRNGLSAPHSAVLWLRSLLAVLDDAPDAVVIDHDRLLSDVTGSLGRLAGSLGCPAPGADVRAAAEAFVDPTLRHHTRRSVDAGGADDDDNPVVALATAVYAGGELDLTVLDPSVAEALRRGWLVAPADATDLQIARARAVELEERLRHQKRRWDAERAARRERP